MEILLEEGLILEDVVTVSVFVSQLYDLLKDFRNPSHTNGSIVTRKFALGLHTNSKSSKV